MMTPPLAIGSPHESTLGVAAREALAHTEQSFGQTFLLFSAEGELLVSDETAPLCDDGWLRELIRTAARGTKPEIIAEEGAVVVLAIPLGTLCDEDFIAVAPFATHQGTLESLADTARILGCLEETAQHWLRARPAWPAHALERMGREVLSRLQERRQRNQFEHDIECVSGKLANCYEEISLLHSISQNFRISISDEELGNQVLDLVTSCIPCENLCMVYLPVAKQADVTYKARTEALLLTQGKCPIGSAEEILELVDKLGIGHGCRPLVVNQCSSDFTEHLPPGVRQFILAPLVEDTRVFGYLMAFNHEDDLEFGTVEASLLASVGAMLGIHCANRDLYREQAELLASVVRALTSAIDAKDPYTCGHSDRVARVATRIAQQLGCDKEFLSTMYMAGLLHDIGKIGIDDAVLRKPGALTDSEYEHIKEHPALGYKILADIKQLAHVLPAVLHHHEQWDGRGYPCKLATDQIPFIARILAVADAYDAMTSDRPYRPGMEEDRVSKIFADGAGRQWDAEVVKAFFEAREDIINIVDNERAGLTLDVQQWI